MEDLYVNDKLARFLSAGKSLAERQLPTGEAHCAAEYRNVRHIRLGRMLAHVAIMPQAGLDRVHLRVFGDPEMARALCGVATEGTLAIEGELPFRPGHSGYGYSGGGRTFFSDDGPHIINGCMFFKGREVDLDRYVVLALMVPHRMNVLIREVIGVVGVGVGLEGLLDLKCDGMTNLYTHDIDSFVGKLSGSVEATMGLVRGDLRVNLSGNGQIQAGSVGGRFGVNLSGNGSVTVNGKTYRPRW